MRNRQWVIDLVASLTDKQTAELIVDRLVEEGILHLGHGDAEVDMIIDAFKEVFGTTKATKADRYAANRLAAKQGSRAVVGVIRILEAAPDSRYKPVVGSIAQLEEKWVSVIRFLRKNNEERLDV